MASLRLLFRFIGIALVFTWGVLFVSVLLLIGIFTKAWRETMVQPLARNWFQLLHYVLGIKATHVGAPDEGPVLLASNHVSWMDVLVLGTRIGPNFVSKSEVASWPIMGWLARSGGTLFIERGRHDSAQKISDEITWRLKRGQQLLFFPEGTTTDGMDIRRFKQRLFKPALRVSARIQPVTICYVLQGAGWDPVQYIDDVSFMQSIVGICRRRRTEVTIKWGSAFQADQGDARAVAQHAEDEVRNALLEFRENREGTYLAEPKSGSRTS